MPPLITREEALRLGEIEDHAEIEALVRARLGGARGALRRLDRHVLAGQRQVRRLRRGLRLLRAVALRRGRDPAARADGARADPRARARRRGRRRAPLLHGHPGPGALQARLPEVPEGVRLVSEHTNLKRCASVGHMSAERARALKEAGVQRVHHNVETASSYYDEVSTTVRYEGRLRTIQAVREAGLETCVGGILNLGESRAQRVEMAFELAALDPTSVPINLLNPRPGHEVRRPRIDRPVGGRQVDRDLPPDHARGALPALRRARREPRRAAAAGRQGRPQRRDDGQPADDPRRRARGRPRDVRRARPERRAPARQRRQPAAGQSQRLAGRRDPRRPRRASRRRPGAARSRGREPPRRRAEAMRPRQVRLWDPSTQLRYRAKHKVPRRPDGAPNANPQRWSEAEANPNPDPAPDLVSAG